MFKVPTKGTALHVNLPGGTPQPWGLWLRQFQARSSPRAFSNFSFPRVGHLLKQVSPGVGHFQSNVILRILKVVHNMLFIIKFPDYPQYKNIKTELINVIWVDPALFK